MSIVKKDPENQAETGARKLPIFEYIHSQSYEEKDEKLSTSHCEEREEDGSSANTTGSSENSMELSFDILDHLNKELELEQHIDRAD